MLDDGIGLGGGWVQHAFVELVRGQTRPADAQRLSSTSILFTPFTPFFTVYTRLINELIFN